MAAGQRASKLREARTYETLGRTQLAIQRITQRVMEQDPGWPIFVSYSSASDAELVSQLLERVAMLEHRRNPLAGARARGARMRGELLAEAGGALTVDEVAAQLEMTRQGVNVRARKGRLVRIPRGKSFVYPRAQFAEEGGTLPGLEEVLHALGLNGWGALRFLLQANALLKGKTPLELLRRGEAVERVVAAAEASGETGGAS